MTRRARILAAGLLGTLALAAPAHAQKLPAAVQEVYKDFGRDGMISPCKHSLDDLRETRRNIPPDIDQYAPDFPDAVRAALEAWARGDCSSDGADTDTGTAAPPTTAPPAPPADTPAPAAGEPTKTVASEPPAPVADAAAAAASTSGTTPAPAPEVARLAGGAAASAGTPAPVWVLGGGAALLGLAALLALIAGRTRRGAEGLDHLRHAWGEWTWRASGTWGEFTDWVRAGR